MSWGLVIVFGFLIVMLAQLAACAVAFRHSAAAGVLSLVVPGYMFFALRRSGSYWPVIAVWFAGVLAVVAGTIAMS